ncbi:MAG: endonuclease/exonuclease/phosphatase family protein [Chloroflexota bacterium]
MKKTFFPIFSFAFLFLFFIQMAGTLIASIYTLDLLNTSLDAKVLGLLFFFSPVFLFVIRKSAPDWLIWVFFGIIFVTRGFLPGLDTNGRMLISGFGTAACLCLMPLLVTTRLKGERFSSTGLYAALGLALTVALSVMLRTMNSSIDYSLTPAGSWIGWSLGVLLGVTLFGLESDTTLEAAPTRTRGITSSVLGIFMALTLIYFVFSAPAVLARWTEAKYAVIVLSTSVFSMAWFVLILFKPNLLKWVTERALIGWNLLFSVALVGTTLAHRVTFPSSPQSEVVVVSTPTFWQQLPLIFTLLLFPVIFFDMQIFWSKLQQEEATPRQIAPGMLLGSFSLVLLVFMNIFTNVWGYVEPVSPFFRNKFWLPFLIICSLLCLLILLHRGKAPIQDDETTVDQFRMWGLVLVAILVVTANGLFVQGIKVAAGESITSLKIMTYNIQQGNDNNGQQSYLRQLALIQKVKPDILALQESDSTRISLNNVDYVRYFADKLGYRMYYGPTTITGSYGTAILSRFPLKNTHTIFSFSDQDENGTAEVQFEVDGKLFNLYNVHPDGSDEAMLAIAKMLLKCTVNQENVIILGDFNMRDTEESYQLIDSVYTNSWMSVYPSGISKEGVDMSGRNRIDHIFISKTLLARDPVYLLPPASATDHPAHWAEIYWED